MKHWKVFKIIAEDSYCAYRLIVPSPSKKEAEIWAGNCGFNIVKTEEMPNKIDVEFLAKIMRENGFGFDEVDIVTRMIQMVGLG